VEESRESGDRLLLLESGTKWGQKVGTESGDKKVKKVESGDRLLLLRRVVALRKIEESRDGPRLLERNGQPRAQDG
jgi:hypothetical protein